jgi:type II secretory pathway pseudopilin PulG
MNSADLVASLKKHPVSVVCVLIAVVCAVLLYVRSGSIAKSQAELAASSTQAARMIANVRSAAGLPEHVAEMQAFSKEVEGRLMKAGQLAVNLQYFYKLETENEVKLVGDPRQGSLKTNARTQYAGVPFSVTVQGTFPHVMNFLNRVQNGRHFCRINSAGFTKVGGTAADMSLTLSIELLGQP